MLLTIPTEVLVVIAIVVIIIVFALVSFLGVFNTKQEEEISNQPEEIKKKADAPEIPTEGQKDKPIDKVDVP